MRKGKSNRERKRDIQYLLMHKCRVNTLSGNSMRCESRAMPTLDSHQIVKGEPKRRGRRERVEEIGLANYPGVSLPRYSSSDLPQGQVCLKYNTRIAVVDAEMRVWEAIPGYGSVPLCCSFIHSFDPFQNNSLHISRNKEKKKRKKKKREKNRSVLRS